MNHRHDILESIYPGQAARYYLAMSIGGTPDQADEGAALILNGTKTATSSPLWDYPDGHIPFVGALSVLLDGQQRAVAVVETVDTRLVRFRDVTDEMAKAYGEGQRTLEWWQRVIGDWYRTKATRDGQNFDENSEILWESISVVRRLTLPMDS
ncbi:ASCH domain-containing protein [Ectopseudomonas hydrolytica]|uniref:ASCH domain-containing protein n=1 Tax=Ectopseudomonas hydrolytica TaxID=2493633 RepID=UPI00376ED0EB